MGEDTFALVSEWMLPSLPPALLVLPPLPPVEEEVMRGARSEASESALKEILSDFKKQTVSQKFYKSDFLFSSSLHYLVRLGMLAKGRVLVDPGWCETGLRCCPPAPRPGLGAPPPPISPATNPTSPKKAPSTPTCPVCCTSPFGPEIMSRLIFLREPLEPRREFL